jgi:predicted MFS family arabinose efflux permease
MFVCSAISAVAMASIVVAAAFDGLSVAQIVLVSFVEGSCAVFFRLAETAALAQVVHQRQLPQAIAQQQLQYSVGSIVGPALGGALFSVSHLLPFVADAGSYGASCLSLGAMRARLAVMGAAARQSLRAEITEGIVWLWHQPLIRYMAGLTGGINLITSGGVLILIVLANQQDAVPFTTGIILAASGAGGILGALLAPMIQRRLSFGQAITGVCWAYCLVWALFTLAATPLLLMMVGAIATMISPAYDTVQMSYRLALIPDALQGRVNSAYRLVADGAKAIGAAATGVMLEWFGASATLLLAAGLFAILATVTTLNRRVREAPRITS